jgi:iron complex transport system ATP-binding protein
VLSGVSFQASAGEFIAVLGRNGAGKSTLLDIIAGLRQPTAGGVRVDGRPIGDWEPRALARRVGHLPQAVRSDLPFSVDELVLMGRYPHTDRWFESAADREAVARAMRRTSCSEFRSRPFHTLSGGERQRVLLAACLAQEPLLLLLDEPSTFLDVDQQLHCFSLLQEEAAGGATCIAVTHDINLALTYASRLVVLANQTIALDIPTSEAGRSSEWLGLFSSRLRVATAPSGRPWVSYA